MSGDRIEAAEDRSYLIDYQSFPWLVAFPVFGGSPNTHAKAIRQNKFLCYATFYENVQYSAKKPQTIYKTEYQRFVFFVPLWF